MRKVERYSPSSDVYHVNIWNWMPKLKLKVHTIGDLQVLKQEYKTWGCWLSSAGALQWRQVGVIKTSLGWP
jgi:hypothetical protein